MATIERLIGNLEAVDFNEVIRESVDETAEEFKNYQQLQMFAGEQSDGGQIQRLDRKYDVYSPFTEYVKTNFRTPRQPIDRVTLRDTGSFYRGFIIKGGKDRAMIENSDTKTEAIIDRYGEKIFGLNARFAEQYVGDLAPVANKKIINLIHK